MSQLTLSDFAWNGHGCWILKDPAVHRLLAEARISASGYRSPSTEGEALSQGPFSWQATWANPGARQTCVSLSSGRPTGLSRCLDKLSATLGMAGGMSWTELVDLAFGEKARLWKEMASWKTS